MSTKDINDITNDDIDKLMKLYFARDGILFSHLYNSFNKFLDEDLRLFLESDQHHFFEKVTRDKVIIYGFKHENITIKSPMIENSTEPLFPSGAINLSQSYLGRIVSKVTQYQEITDIVTNEKKIQIIGEPEENVPITNMPIMVKSAYCSLNLYEGYDKSECEYDPGGYFIIAGSEKVIISQDRLCENKVIVFVKKDSGNDIYVAQLNSKSYKPAGMSQIVSIRMKNDKVMTIRVPIINEMPIVILIRALGIVSDKDIVSYICGRDDDNEMSDLLQISLNAAKNDKGERIQTMDDAIDYIMTKMRVVKRYSDADKNIRYQQKKLHLKFLLRNGFIPHMDCDLKEKGIYLCTVMCRRLLRCYLGRIEKDDRDSYINKRIDLPGDLLFELFKHMYRKMLSDCGKFFRKRNQSDETPINIINQIKPGTIEQGLKTALATGTWTRKKGVAQMLPRTTYMVTMTFLRRIDAPGGDSSTNKLTSPRHVHPSSVRWMCCVCTPEHAPVGLKKHLTIIGNVTIMRQSQCALLRQHLEKKVISILDIPPLRIIYYTKLFLNGELLGLLSNPFEVEKELKHDRAYGKYDPTISIVHDIPQKELRVYCDGGRGYAPALKVENNILRLKKDHLDKISLNKAIDGKITSWEEFMMKYPGVIEYIDMEEQQYLMFAESVSDVEKMRQNMEKSIQRVKDVKPGLIVNRYDDMMYVRYSHCEYHPSLLVGDIATTIPFSNSNFGTRNIFQYAQGKQAMGIYISNYRDRFDISYILFNPQRPLVMTRTSKYIHADALPSGENAIVAIACYSGYNVEDSLIFNKSSVQRGRFSAMYLKKYMPSIQKNQSTTQDDIFMKPDHTKVSGMKPGSYDKLNEKGYVKEETVVNNQDIIIGKVTPIPPSGNSTKIFKDSSEVYRYITPGVIDKVHSDIYNSEGYKMMKVRVRSTRIPNIGDKFCSRYGQKGTVGILTKASDLMFSKEGIIPDIILNPHAIPGRMTIAQLIECLMGKVAANKGVEADGTAFNNIDLESIKDELEKLGYHRDGVEYMYNGMTGQKMKSMIFIGPTYYQRLKHLVADKIHSRSRGPRAILTKQPPDGRARDGGLKFGEMERDAMISHGVAVFLKERLLDTSDPYITRICDICGLFAIRTLRSNSKRELSASDIFHCPACKNSNKISTIMIPYAFKLLIQELQAMNITARIVPDTEMTDS